MRVYLLAEKEENIVKDLIHQSQGIDLSSASRLFRKMGQIALLVDLVGKGTHRIEIGKQNITVQSEEGLIKLKFIARLAGNMEFHAFSLVDEVLSKL